MEILERINDFFNNVLNDPLSILIVISVMLLGFAFFVLVITNPKKDNKVNEPKIKEPKIKEAKTKKDKKEEKNIIKEEKDADLAGEKTDKEEISLRKGYKYVVSEKNKLKPGKYKVYSADDKISSFEIDRGSYSKTYENGDTLDVKDNHEIISKSVALKLEKV